MTIKCVASIYSAYYKTVEVTVGLRRRNKHRRRQHEERVTVTSTSGPEVDHHNGNLHQLCPDVYTPMQIHPIPSQ